MILDYNVVADILIALGPILGYIGQYRILKETKSMGSFSIYITAILLLANILRIYFWFTIGYAFNLFLQSLFMIVFQLLLLKQCVKISPPPQKKSFWKWNSFQQYIYFLIMFTAVLTILTTILRTNEAYGNLVGMLSMGIEATLGLPQFIANFQTKSVKGLSISMIGSWFFGDFSKTIYFIMKKQPFQFILCGTVQLLVDVAIIRQMFIYKENKVEYEQVSKDEK